MADRPAENIGQTPKWKELNDLANGGHIIFSTDDWFASAERLLAPEDPVWKEGFTEQGKWMDGWETRRKRIAGHDWCIIKLGMPGIIQGVELDTSFFTGNFAPSASLQGIWLDPTSPCLQSLPPREGAAGQCATPSQLSGVAQLNSEMWPTLVDKTQLRPGYKDTCRTYKQVDEERRISVTHIRLNLFPDGGVARLRLYGVSVPQLPDSPFAILDLSSAVLGGVCIGYSDAHYGHPRNMIKSDRGKDMGDGWETARRLDRPSVLTSDENGILKIKGSEWAAFKLGLQGSVRAVEIDTNHFKGNYPDSVMIEAADAVGEDQDRLLDDDGRWIVLLSQVKLGPHKQHYFPMEKLSYTGNVSHIRVRMFPDGGISRIGILGRYNTQTCVSIGDLAAAAAATRLLDLF